MKNRTGSHRMNGLAIAALGLTIAGGSFAAQPVVDEVVVERTRPTLGERRSSSGARVEVVSVTQRVSYSDLDLVSHAGVIELEARINETARDVCLRLHQIVHLSPSERLSCVKDAVAESMKQARAAIAVAEGRYRSAALTTVR